MRKLCFALLAAAAPALADVEAGNWELTVTVTVDGMPGPMAPVTRARCISPEEARYPSRRFRMIFLHVCGRVAQTCCKPFQNSGFVYRVGGAVYNARSRVGV